eukprot:Gb_36241 [translate_table: standard]
MGGVGKADEWLRSNMGSNLLLSCAGRLRGSSDCGYAARGERNEWNWKERQTTRGLMRGYCFRFIPSIEWTNALARVLTHYGVGASIGKSTRKLMRREKSKDESPSTKSLPQMSQTLQRSVV